MVSIIAGLVVCISATLLIAAPYSPIASFSTAQAQQMIEVQAGGGNAIAPLAKFIPEKVQITAGQSITCVNPTTVGEPHTVTFVLDNKTMTGAVSALGVPNGTHFYTHTAGF